MTLAAANTDDKYTKSEQKILEFIEAYTDEFLFMSIGQLAEKLQMSEATISRFARHIGYGDFKELKRGVAKQKAGNGPARKIAGTLLKDSGFDIGRWFAFQQECLEKTLEHMDLQVFSEAVTRIQQAKNIYIHGKNASQAAGQLLYFRLRRLGFHVNLIPSGGSEVMEGIAHAGEGDLVILFSFSKVSREGRMILEYAKTAGYATLAFTSRLYAPVEQRADSSIYVYRGEKEEYHSMTSAVSVIDALVLALSENMHAVSAERLMRVHQLKEAYRRSAGERGSTQV